MENDCEKNQVILRQYQIKIIEKAKKQNSIIYLPTGAGKTLIAIKVLCSKARELLGSYPSVAKRAIFLCHTKVLVHQIAANLKYYTNFDIGSYVGDMNVDSWNRNTWEEELEKNQVLVLTAEIFRNILSLNYITSNNISIVVFDECHHAVNNHPFREVMKELLRTNPNKTPLILGLSAVLINQKVMPHEIRENLEALKKTYRAELVTEEELGEVLSLTTECKPHIIVFNEYECPQTLDSVISILENARCTLQKLHFNSTVSQDRYKSKKASWVYSFKQCVDFLKELGPYCGSLSALYYTVFIDKLRITSSCLNEICSLNYARTELTKARLLLSKIMGGEKDDENYIYRNSSPKIQKFIAMIRDLFKEDTLILVFVQQRITSVILSNLLKRLSSVEKNFQNIKAEFIVGGTAKCWGGDMSTSYHKNEEILERFASKHLNILVATNILEEGVDISGCNFVISFDSPKTFSSFYQSRGRIRNKLGKYFVFVGRSHYCKTVEEIDTYTVVESELRKIVTSYIEKEIPSNSECDEDETIKIGNANCNGRMAVKCVERYYSIMRRDIYSSASPIIYKRQWAEGKQAILSLPNSPLRGPVEGEIKKNFKMAKESAFLKAVMLLHELGELDDDLNYKILTLDREFSQLFPHYQKENVDKNEQQTDMKQKKQNYEIHFPACLSNCLPSPGRKAFLHVMKFTIDFEKPSIDRKIILYDLFNQPCTFAIMSTKSLAEICNFPLFVNLGQISCDLLVNYSTETLSEKQFLEIKSFHFSLFKKVLNVIQDWQVFDDRNEGNSFFIVPMNKEEKGRYTIKWDLIRTDFCKQSDVSALVRYNRMNASMQCDGMSSVGDWNTEQEQTSQNLIPFSRFGSGWDTIEVDEEPNKFEFHETDYKYFVLAKNYGDSGKSQNSYYVVSQVCYNMTPLSPFPNDTFKDYATYYKVKYNKDVNLKQPLIKVSILEGNSNFNKCPTNAGPKSRKFTEKYQNFEEILIPEMCEVIPFLNTFWIKATILPTVLNRITQIYLVDELRNRIINETGMGLINPPQNTCWKPLKPDNFLELQENQGQTQSCLPLTRLMYGTDTPNDKFICDWERNLFDTGECDLKYEFSILKDPKLDDSMESDCRASIMDNDSDLIVNLEEIHKLEVPLLRILGNIQNLLGPELAQLLEACTGKGANDIVNYERLETLGDSFLKIGVSLYLFRNYSHDEGLLSSLKGKLVGNKNLLYCGCAKNIHHALTETEFEPRGEWNPPLFHTPERLIEASMSKPVDSLVIESFAIPSGEQYTGKVSEETFKRNEKIIDEAQAKKKTEPYNPLCPYRKLKDKSVSDCVEAIIGCYLQACGIPCAFEILMWLNILPKWKGSYTLMIAQPYICENFNAKNEEMAVYLLTEVLYLKLEKILGYTFKNKLLLLEALTHPSYEGNRLTGSYQRLEFLGDAILDFLITSYIFEYCTEATPGEITDMRSALVNNSTFACLTIRYKLFKYMLSCSSTLNNAIANFHNFQKKRNHVVDEQVFILIEEKDCLIADTFDVPKALGDIFESLAGAIFLDSGNSLQTVWEVYYRLMKGEIDQFTKNIPKNSIRKLEEVCDPRPNYDYDKVHNKIRARCNVYYEDKEIVVYGFGRNKKNAKLSAAKMALKEIMKSKSN